MSRKTSTPVAAIAIAACLVVAGVSFYMGIITIASLTSTPETQEPSGETRVESFFLENHLNPSNRVFLTLNLSNRVVINYILAKCDMTTAGLYYILPALSINGSSNVTIGTTTKPMCTPLEFTTNWQYAYPGNRTLVLSPDPGALLVLSLYRNTGGPYLDFEVRVSYTVYHE